MKYTNFRLLTFTCISLILLSCGLDSDCPDESPPTTTTIVTDSIKVNYSQYYYIAQDSSSFSFGNKIALKVYTNKPENNNLLPSFSANNLSLYINDHELIYSRIDNSSGGIHGLCPDWEYPNSLHYFVASQDTAQSIIIRKNGSIAKQWPVKFSIDTSKLALISDTVTADSELAITIKFRDKSNSYSGYFLKFASMSWDISIPNPIPDSLTSSIKLCDIPANQEIDSIQTDKRFIYSTIITAATAPQTKSSAPNTLVGYEIQKRLSNSSLNAILKYQQNAKH